MKRVQTIGKIIFLVFFVTIGLLDAATAKVNDDPLIRITKQGSVKGFQDIEGTLAWKGLPFAKALKWKAPAEPAKWEGIRDATQYSDFCLQPGTDVTMMGSLDCLYLNIWRPDTDEENLPVYMWIHGGGNIGGTSATYDGSHLASKANMVVVTIQYRLGVFGYFTHPALRNLTDDDDEKRIQEASGNFGLLDQIAALKWIKKNIENFGGDKHNVTIAGQSAGGDNVYALMATPLAENLFHKAVMHSGGVYTQPREKIDESADRTIEQALIMDGTASSAEEAYMIREGMTEQEIGQYLRGLDEVLLLRANTASSIFGFPWGRVIVDGNVIPADFPSVFESGNYHKVPIMMGTVKHEAKLLNLLLPSLFPGMPNYQNALFNVAYAGADLEDVLTQNEIMLFELLSYYQTRLWKATLLDEIAMRIKQHQDDVFVYEFTWGIDDMPYPYNILAGANHGLEIPFFHGTVDSDITPGGFYHYGFTPQNLDGRVLLSNALISYFQEFAVSGDPNAAGSALPQWDAWSNEPGAGKSLIVDTDMNNLALTMSTDSLSISQVRMEIDALSPSIRRVMNVYLMFIQTYSLFTPGDY